VELTTLPPSCADFLEIWKPQPPGILWAWPGTFWYAVVLPRTLLGRARSVALCWRSSHTHTVGWSLLYTARKHVGLIVVSTGADHTNCRWASCCPWKCNTVFKCVCEAYDMSYVFYILKLTQLVESRTNT
jgi:hypothetical protein